MRPFVVLGIVAVVGNLAILVGGASGALIIAAVIVALVMVFIGDLDVLRREERERERRERA